MDDDSEQSDRDQLIDLVVEDEEAEEIERVRGRKSGNPHWNNTESKHFVKVYGDSGQEEEVREGLEPDEGEAGTMSSALRRHDSNEHAVENKQWQTRDHTDGADQDNDGHQDHKEPNVWDSPKG